MEQPSLGRAMTGMGCPSTWTEVLDEQGKPIPKRDRSGKIIREENGEIRTVKETEKQGIVDWIEEEKKWIQEKMLERYGWEREYKGSHPRGNLSTLDYKVTRSKERLQEVEQQLHRMLLDYTRRSRLLMKQMEKTVEENVQETPELQIILNYAKLCDEERYQELLSDAVQMLDDLSKREKDDMWKSLQAILDDAQRKKGNDENATIRKDKSGMVGTRRITHNGVNHGNQCNYGTREHTLKLILCLDALEYVAEILSQDELDENAG